MLANVDVILVDLQDVGGRYYTWLATTVHVMQSAARAGKTVVVLDRPNPIGGAMQGNIARHRVRHHGRDGSPSRCGTA